MSNLMRRSFDDDGGGGGDNDYRRTIQTRVSTLTYFQRAHCIMLYFRVVLFLLSICKFLNK